MPLKVVKRHGSRYWYLRGTVRGLAVDESTGTNCKETAEEIRAIREAEILHRSVYGKQATASWLEASTSYVENGGEVRFLDGINALFGMTPLARIDQSAIDKGARALYPNGQDSTLNRQFYGKVSAVLKHAAKRGMCDYRVVSRKPEPLKKFRWLKPLEAEGLIEAAAAHLKPFIILSLYTGARVSEALYLDWEQVDLSGAHVSFLETKNGTARGVHLHPRVVAALANLTHREGCVFHTHEGLRYEPKGDGGGQIKTGFSAAIRRAGLSTNVKEKKVTPHTLRHTFASWHYQHHRDLRALQDVGGWKSLSMVMRYAHLNSGNQAVAIDALPWGKFGEGDIPKEEVV